jgi:hypothetical protein
MSAYNKQATSRQCRQVPAQCRTQAPPHLVPHHGLPHRLAHHEANPRGLCRFTCPDEQVAGQQIAPGPAAAADREVELSPAAHPGFCGEHARPPPSRGAQSGGGRRAGAGAARGGEPARGREEQGHTLTLARPFRRRAASTARPALVRIRSRNPCVLARRRLFGWNVRLLTGGSTWRCQHPAVRPRGAPARSRLPGKVFESVHVTRIPDHGSNRRRTRRPGPGDLSREQERAFAERGTHATPRLWTTGQAVAQRGGAGRPPSGPAAFGHGAECGVHSLWIRLLIRMWGRKVNTR